MSNLLRAHAVFKRKYNKLDSNNKRDLPPALIDDILYESTLEYLEEVYSANILRNKIKRGSESTQQKMDMLKYYLPDPITITPVQVSSTEYYIELPEDYLHHYKSSYLDSVCDRNINIEITDHNNIGRELTDNNTKPSLVWNRSIGIFKNTKLYFYVDEDSIPTNVVLTYLRCPVRHFFGGYDSLEFLAGDTNAPSANTNSNLFFDVPEKYSDIIVDYAVREVSRELYDPHQHRFRDDKIINSIS